MGTSVQEVKLCLLGDAGVGKSSIVHRFVYDAFKPTMENTIGAAFLTKSVTLDMTVYKYQIWDTAGQEKYRALAPMYYRGAAAAIIVYDITVESDVVSITAWPQLKDLFIRLNTPVSVSAAVERLFSCAGMIMNNRRTRLSDKTFENLVFLKVNSWMETKQNEGSFNAVKSWIRELKQYADHDIAIAIAGNKCDLEDMREIPRKDAQEYAEQHGAVFVETSAKTAVNIAALFLEISKHLSKSDSRRKDTLSSSDTITPGRRPPNAAVSSNSKTSCCT